LKSLRSVIACGAALAGILTLVTFPAAAQTAPASATATSQAATAPVTPPLRPPPAESFRAYDRPSDDGSAIIVEWAKPEKETEGDYYVVEIARDPNDFAAGRFETQVVKPSPKALKYANPQYFASSARNRKLYYAEVSPGALLHKEEPFTLTAEKVEQLRKEGVLSDDEADRAVSVLKTAEAKKELSAAEKRDAKWCEFLKAHLTKRAKELAEAEAARINATTCYFRLAAARGTGPDQQKAYVVRDGEPVIVSASAHWNVLKVFKLNTLLFALCFSAAVLAFIHIARRNPNLFIRKIPGLEAVEEAIGRATEMGRSVYFVHGLNPIGSLSTIAAVNILGRVARRSAEYDVRVRVMNVDPIVTAVSQEVVQQAYTEAGRPDAYDADDVSLMASDQFSFVAAVSGRMVREQPAAVFLMGYFYAESLLLAETGASTGAIQVAGTDAFTQLPFFVTTCDYTLIGEELYAASAYLSREPRMLGSLRGQDVGKAFLMAVIVVVALALTVGIAMGLDVAWLRNLFKAFS